MADEFKLLNQTQLTGGATNDTLVTVPAGNSVIVRHMRVVNFHGSADVKVKMWHNPNGEGGANANDDLILPSVTINAGGWGEFEGTIILNSGDTLVANSDTASAVTVSVYGLEITP